MKLPHYSDEAMSRNDEEPRLVVAHDDLPGDDGSGRQFDDIAVFAVHVPSSAKRTAEANCSLCLSKDDGNNGAMDMPRDLDFLSMAPHDLDFLCMALRDLDFLSLGDA